MPDWTRVRDKQTRHQYTTALVEDGEEVLDKPAVDGSGRPLPFLPHVPVNKRGDETTTDGPKAGSKESA